MTGRLVVALGLDALLGDPPHWPHPVRAIGRAAEWMERATRPRFAPRTAGIVTAATVAVGSCAAVSAIIRAARRVHPALAACAEIYFLFSAIAMRDLARHAADVQRALESEDLPAARERLSRIVGRDTADLDEAGIVRASVETVAENLCDGVTAPILFAALGGAPLAWFQKSVSTLDSSFGYTTDEYIDFGWASAKLDDAVHWLPARLTAAVVPVAVAVTGDNPVRSWRITRRDAGNHASPNAGWGEAAFAGALGIRLGGPGRYGGEIVEKPVIGDAVREPQVGDIARANRLMIATTLVFTTLVLGVKWKRRNSG